MLDKGYFGIDERLKPMLEKAVETQSFGLRVICTSYMVVPQVATPLGPRPGWGIYIQAHGKLLGKENHVAQLSIITNPMSTQEEVDEIVRVGCDSLREQINEQGILSNGKN